MSEQVFVICDASGEYLSASRGRTPASDEALEFDSRDEAEAARTRASDTVLVREID